MTEYTAYPCGCGVAPNHPSGVLRSVVKCRRHLSRQRNPVTLDESYYAELGVIRDGRLVPTAHVADSPQEGCATIA